MHAEKILGLTRRILHYANRGYPRYIFLQEISKIIFDFSNCDELEILHKDGSLCYRWQAGNNLATTPRFEVIPDHCEGEISVNLKMNSPIERLYGAMLSKDFDNSLSCFTENGSFWTSDIIQIPEPVKCAIMKDGNNDKEYVEKYRSLTVLPFEIDENNKGILALKKLKQDFFTRDDVKYYESVAQTLGLAAADRRAQAALQERVKELTCLYGIARIAELQEIDLDDKLQRIVELLPPSWQHPDIALARITLDDNEYVTTGFQEGRYRQSAEIIVDSIKRGSVELVYIDDKPELAQVPFLSEEVSLIEEIARQIGSIVEMVEAERDKAKLQEQLRHADRLATLGQLAARVAHEINEPLGSILGFAQLAKKNLSDSDQTERDLNKIENASLQARDIIRNMLIFARQLPTSKRTINLNRVVEETLSFFDSRCGKEGIELIHRLSKTLPKIDADPAQLNQLLVNLLVNAIQAMPEGGILSIATTHDDKNVSLSVKDTGVGMSDEIKKRIFDPFFTTKDVDQGTGLGLSVIHGIVTSHGGSIEVDSQIGLGSNFNVILPITNSNTKMRRPE